MSTTSATPLDTLSSTRPSPAFMAPLCLAATWLIWGSTYLAIKWALLSFPPFFQMGSRFVAAALLLGTWARWQRTAWPTPRQWRNAVVLGLLMLGGGYGLTAVAAAHVASGLVVAFIAVVPAMVALAQWPYGVRPGGREIAGIALGLIGVWLLAQGQGFSGSWTGLLAIVGACLTWSAGTVWAKHGLPGGHSLALAPGAMGYASQMLAGGGWLLLMSLLAGELPQWPAPGSVQPQALWSWLYLVVAGSLMGFTAYMWLLQHRSATLASSYTYVNPVIGLLLGVTLGGEHVSAGEWIASGVVLAGVVLLLMPKRPGARQPAPADPKDCRTSP